MAKSNNQKGKILYLEHLLHETGEDHVVSMQEILAYLLDRGIHAERKSIYDDLEVLRSFGMDIQYRRGKPGGYFYMGGQAAAPEIDYSTEAVEPKERNDTFDQDLLDHRQTHSDGVQDHPEEMNRQLRQVKLIYSEEAAQEVKKYFGEEAQYKERMDGTYSVTAQASETPAFFGWLTMQGVNVRLQKPRKMAQSYREYLKEILRIYKEPR